MVKSVAREFKWSPAAIGDLFFDGEDYLGLIYWFRDTKESDQEVKDLVAKMKNKQ